MIVRLGVIIMLIAFAPAQSGAWIHGLAAARQPLVLCDITTGIATGIGAGTCAATPASCNGVADDATSFAQFNAFAITWQGAHSGPIGLTWPAGKDCVINANTVSCGPVSAVPSCVFRGIADLIVIAYGASFHPNSPFTLGGVGLTYVANSSARLVTANAGDSCVTTITASQASFFTPGVYAMISGFDMQGVFGFQGFGQPPNPYYYEYPKVISANASTGQVCFNAPLANAYLSTWPAYDQGSAVGHANDQGGPATLYVMDASWDSTIEFRGMTLERTGQQAQARSRTVILRDVILTGADCFIPSNNDSVTFINVTGAACSIETDKIVNTFNLVNSNINEIKNQSSSLAIAMNGTNIPFRVQGTPKSFIASNSIFGQLNIGASAFGRTNVVSCTNCNIGAFSATNFLEQGAGTGIGVNRTWTMAGGLITIPNGSGVAGSADNGSGQIRVQLVSTAGLVTGKFVNFNGVCRTGLSSPGVCPGGSGLDPDVNGANQVTVIDATHVDIAKAFVAADISGGSVLTPAPRWAMPGTNFCFSGGGSAACQELHQVTAVTQDATNTYVQTNASGGFPTPSSGSAINIQVHPAPSFTCSSCTGAAGVGLNFPAGDPLFSWSTITMTGAAGTAANFFVNNWGQIVSIDLNLTNAFTGGGALSWNMSQFNNLPIYITGSPPAVGYGAVINGKITGLRHITKAGVTGTQTGDSGLALPDAVTDWMAGGALSGAKWSVDTSGSCPGVGCPSITATIHTDAGVVPTVNYLLRRDLDPAANDNRPMWIEEAA